jgi:tungstate transport system substrate-binding protein
MKRFLTVFLVLLMMALPAMAQTASLRLAVTTSFHNSGLSDVLLPRLLEDEGITVELLVVGTGQALRLGEAGDVDAVLVHAKQLEAQFVEAGFGPYRREIMYNDFVVIGPQTDPAKIEGVERVSEALGAIAQAQSRFISRGDNSGTHNRELALWAQAGLEPSEFSASWYLRIGAGMGAALNIASELGAYVVSDRASWLNFGRKDRLGILFEGDMSLFNQYSYLPVSQVRHPTVNYHTARRVENWLVSKEIQEFIGMYQIEGQQLFVPNAR